MKKKLFALITGLALVAMIVPSSAQAITAEELQAQIDALLAQLADLQAQLAELTGEAPTVTGCTITSFDRNLKQGDTGDDVNCLQIVLNSDSDTQLASSGVGSPGNETSYFGPLTKGAVIKFQEKYADEVLASWGLTSGTGYVGTTTRAKLNSLLAAAPAEEEEEEEEEEVPAAVPSGLSVALASDTPEAASVATGANANFTKFTLTAGSEGDVKISKIYVTRSGLTANSDLENIKIIDAETGTYKGSIGSLNVDNRAMITFTKKLVIPAGETKEFYIRAGIVSGATAGKTAKLGIASADDIVSDASEISGSFPITGNTMTVVSINIGSASVNEDGTTVDSQPDVGDTDVTINQFKVTAGSTEPITIETITVMKAGTADASDTGNIELYDVTNGKSLGTVDSWDSEDKATWSNLNIVVDKGDTQRFKVKADILDGLGLTVGCDLVDGSDTLMSVKGNTYGFYITPTRTGSWGGTPSNNQTIRSGSLNISKSAKTPATGLISPGDDIELAVFDFDAKGEEIKITAVQLNATLGTMTYDQVTNVSIYDEDGNIVAGPQDLGSGSTVSFTDTFIVPLGVHSYTVKAKIADDVSSLDTILISYDAPSTSSSAANTTTATGMTSNNTIYPTPYSDDVAANTQTVAAGDLDVTTLSYPAARSVPAGINDFVWAVFSLDATNSGEDVQVTAIDVYDNVNSTGDLDDIDNMELWADLTSENSSRGDVYETRISDAENPSGSTEGTDTEQAFTLSQTVTVPKGTFVRVALVADLAAGAAANSSHTFYIDGSTATVTSTGASTGSSITETYSGSGQEMTVAGSGTLTVTRDSSSPISSLVLGGETATLAVFRLAANNVEDLDLDSIKIYASGSSAVETFYFYSDSRSDGVSTDTPIGSQPGGATAEIQLSDGTVTIPANDSVKITVKANLRPVGTNTGVDDDTTLYVQVNQAGDIDTTGLSSGSAVDNTDTNVGGYSHYAVESKPTFAVNASSPSGTLVTSSTTELARFDITASSTEDITFQNDDDDQILVSVTCKRTDSDGGNETITVTDQDGNTLDSITSQDICASTITIDFSSNDLTIPAGQTKWIKIVGDTTDLGDAGDTIQLYLDDGNSGNNINWAIDGNNADIKHGDIIFRGDIMAGALVTPSGSSD